MPTENQENVVGDGAYRRAGNPIGQAPECGPLQCQPEASAGFKSHTVTTSPSENAKAGEPTLSQPEAFSVITGAPTLNDGSPPEARLYPPSPHQQMGGPLSLANGGPPQGAGPGTVCCKPLENSAEGNQTRSYPNDQCPDPLPKGEAQPLLNGYHSTVPVKYATAIDAEVVELVDPNGANAIWPMDWVSHKKRHLLQRLIPLVFAITHSSPRIANRTEKIPLSASSANRSADRRRLAPPAIRNIVAFKQAHCAENLPPC